MTIQQRRTSGDWRLQTTAEWLDAVKGESPDAIMDWATHGDFHTKQGRSTGRISLRDGQLSIYLKRHWQLPLRDRLCSKVMRSGCWTPASVEWHNLQWARQAGFHVPEPLALGEQHGPGLQLRSFLAIRELTGMLALHQAIPLAYSLMPETAFQHWKQQLLMQVAETAKRLHRLHRYHKDLYLCHFYVKRPVSKTMSTGPLFLIDLHRLSHHHWAGWRWQIKDLAQLYFSTWGVTGLSDDDRTLIMQQYLGATPWTTGQQWLHRAVLFKALRYASHNKTDKELLRTSTSIRGKAA